MLLGITSYHALCIFEWLWRQVDVRYTYVCTYSAARAFPYHTRYVDRITYFFYFSPSSCSDKRRYIARTFPQKRFLHFSVEFPWIERTEKLTIVGKNSLTSFQPLQRISENVFVRQEWRMRGDLMPAGLIYFDGPRDCMILSARKLAGRVGCNCFE